MTDVCEKMLTALSGCLDDAEREAALASQLERATKQAMEEREQAIKEVQEASARWKEKGLPVHGRDRSWPQPKGNEIEARVVEHTAKRLGQLLAAPEAWAGSMDTAEVLMLELVEVWLVAMGGNEERAGKVTERWRAHLDEQACGANGTSMPATKSRTVGVSSLSGAARVRWSSPGTEAQALASLMRSFIGKELTWPAVDISKVGLDGTATYRFTEEGPWLLRG